jgi:hypothetical protein
MNKLIVYIFILFLACSILAYGAEVKVIKEPAPLFSGLSNAKKLILEKSIEEIGDKEFDIFAGITSATVDKQGNYYFFDFRHGTIIKMNRELKFVRSIGRRGEGPGEFKGKEMTPNHISIGLDGKLYLANWQGRRIIKYSLDGKHLGDVKFQQFKGLRVSADEKGNLYLPSIKEHIIDIHAPDMKYKKSLIPIEELKTFLFIKPPPCVIYRYTIPYDANIGYDWLSTKELLLVNMHDLSITIMNPETGKVRKKFYAWDDFILSEFEIRIKKVLKRVEDIGAACGYTNAFSSLFVDHEDNIYLQFVDSQGLRYLYKFSSDGELIRVYQIERAQIDGSPRFFQFKDNKFYSFSEYAIHIFKEKTEK